MKTRNFLRLVPLLLTLGAAPAAAGPTDSGALGVPGTNQRNQALGTWGYDPATGSLHIESRTRGASRPVGRRAAAHGVYSNQESPR
jgi:hypothetical protein